MEARGKLNDEVYKILKSKLNEYNSMQERILEIESSLTNNAGMNSGIKSKNKINRSVENIAIALADNKEYQELKSWRQCIDDLVFFYISFPAKIKFLKRRYIDKELVNLKVDRKYKIKDCYVIEDLQAEGYKYDERTFRRWKNEMLYDLYRLAKEDKILKKIYNF